VPVTPVIQAASRENGPADSGAAAGDDGSLAFQPPITMRRVLVIRPRHASSKSGLTAGVTAPGQDEEAAHWKRRRNSMFCAAWPRRTRHRHAAHTRSGATPGSKFESRWVIGLVGSLRARSVLAQVCTAWRRRSCRADLNVLRRDWVDGSRTHVHK
jgi:hypothetical protein